MVPAAVAGTRSGRSRPAVEGILYSQGTTTAEGSTSEGQGDSPREQGTKYQLETESARDLCFVSALTPSSIPLPLSRLLSSRLA